jgi:hypothetical protein
VSQQPEPNPQDRDLRATLSTLDKLLDRQLQRVRGRFLLHGSGFVLAAALGAIVGYYLIDRSLQLPAGVRVLATIALAAWLGYEVYRRVVLPQSKRLLRTDVAIALERRFPALQERLITAHQLGARLGETEGALRDESPAMVRAVVEQAASEARALPVHEFFDTPRTRRLWTLGVSLAALLVTLFAVDPDGVRAFGARLFGTNTAYPRATTLVVELPPPSTDYRIEYPSSTTAVVTLAAGADLPVLVRAEGVVPREVDLVVRGARGMPPTVAMTPRRDDGRRFRYLFRRVREGMTFYARGNDDPRGDRTIEVRVVQPPRVGTIRTKVELPAYAAASIDETPEEIEGGAVEALVGSTVSISVEPTTAVDSAMLRFLESEREVELTPEGVTDDSGRPARFVGRFPVQGSDRYQVELLGDIGLRDPDPGTYPVVAIEDLAPAGRLLLPDDGSAVNFFLPTGLLPLRLLASDDFGLGRVDLEIVGGRAERTVTLDLLEGRPDAPGTGPREFVTTRLVPLASTLAPTAGESLTIEVDLADRREPEALTTELPGRPVYIVEPIELARRIAGQLRQVREEVEEARTLQQQRVEFRAGLEEDIAAGAKLVELRSTLARIEVGQGRVLTSATRLHRELMRSFDVHLFNRIEESVHAERVLELYREWHAEHAVAEAQAPGFYRAVSEARNDGRIGAMEKTLDPILEMVRSCDRLATDLAPRAVETFESALILDDRQALQERLARAGELQAKILAELDALLVRLDRWNEFQDVVGMARALRNAQLDILNRTESEAEDATEGDRPNNRGGR